MDTMVGGRALTDAGRGEGARTTRSEVSEAAAVAVDAWRGANGQGATAHRALAKGQGGLRQHGFGPPVDVTERIERSSVSSAGAIVHAIAQRPAARGVECPQALLRWAEAR